jgi:hypothetical protein
MNIFYVANDTVVIGRPAHTRYFHPRDQKRKRGEISKIVDSACPARLIPFLKQFNNRPEQEEG